MQRNWWLPLGENFLCRHYFNKTAPLSCVLKFRFWHWNTKTVRSTMFSDTRTLGPSLQDPHFSDCLSSWAQENFSQSVCLFSGVIATHLPLRSWPLHGSSTGQPRQTLGLYRQVETKVAVDKKSVPLTVSLSSSLCLFPFDRHLKSFLMESHLQMIRRTALRRFPLTLLIRTGLYVKTELTILKRFVVNKSDRTTVNPTGSLGRG
jgi:hypothetical protein